MPGRYSHPGLHSWLVSEPGLPIVVKGILTGEDARLACDSGVAGIIVSNHGGRQLERLRLVNE